MLGKPIKLFDTSEKLAEYQPTASKMTSCSPQKTETPLSRIISKATNSSPRNTLYVAKTKVEKRAKTRNNQRKTSQHATPKQKDNRDLLLSKDGVKREMSM